MQLEVQVASPQINIYQGQTVLSSGEDGQIVWPAGKGRYSQGQAGATGRQSAARARDMLVAVMLLVSAAASAQQPAPPGMSLAEAAAKRFPQPVRVGDLIGRTVLRPLESQPVLGHVKQVVRTQDGAVDIVLDYGGLFGIGGRLIAVPVDAMVLLGAEMEVVDFTPKQLDALATFNGNGVTAIQPQDTIRVGLARPSH